MDTFTFKSSSSGSIYCYRLERIQRVYHYISTMSSGLTEKKVRLETVGEGGNLCFLYYKYKEEDGNPGKGYYLDPGEYKMKSEKLNDCIRLLRKLVENGFLSEEGYNLFLDEFRESLIHYYDGQTKQAEKKLEEKEKQIKHIQKSDVDNEKLESEIEDLMNDMDLLSRITQNA